MHFSFFMFFSDFVIFQVVKWMFLLFHDFHFSCHIPHPTVDISKLSNFFCFPRLISPPKVCISHFPEIFSFFAIFQVLQCAFLIFHVFQCFIIFQVVKWMFLIFHDFQFSCHIPRPTVDISKFSTFFSFPRLISPPKVCISHFPEIFSFLAIFQVLQCAFLIFHVFQ